MYGPFFIAEDGAGTDQDTILLVHHHKKAIVVVR
jgi:hypothetical protein